MKKMMQRNATGAPRRKCPPPDGVAKGRPVCQTTPLYTWAPAHRPCKAQALCVCCSVPVFFQHFFCRANFPAWLIQMLILFYKMTCYTNLDCKLNPNKISLPHF